MIVKIGIISGEILDLLEQRNGLLEYYEIQSGLKEPHDLVLMSLGWLLGKRYIYITANPLKEGYKNDGYEMSYRGALSMFDLVIAKPLDDISNRRIKIAAQHISHISGEILALLREGKNSLGLDIIRESLHESSEIILMSLGWLLREGYVQVLRNARDNFVFQLNPTIESPDNKKIFMEAAK